MLKLKKRNTSTNALLLNEYDNNMNIYSLTSKRITPIANEYFPKDFSLNMYKSTSFYKNRYQIEPFRLKYQIKRIKNLKGIKKINHIIKSFRTTEKENSFSSDLLRLLKSNRIDTFAKRYLEKYKLNSNFNNYNLSPNNKFKKNDENKIKNDIIVKNLKTNLEKRKFPDNINPSEDILTFRYLENSTKNFRINSASLTNQINNVKCNSKNNKRNHNLIERHQSTEAYNINNYFLFSPSSYNNSSININYKNQRKNNKIYINDFSKNKKKNMKLFYTKKIKSDLNNNINNNLNNNKKLIFSFYDPNDKDIKIFQKLEEKRKKMNNNIK